VTVSFYLDTSVIVALLTDDPLHTRADRFFRDDRPILMISDFASAEFAAVIARRVRVGAIAADQARIGFSLLDAWSARSATRVEISAADGAVAEAFLRRLDLPLQAPDAIHIAIAERIGATLVTFDRQMEAGARALGMAVATP
jgi:predicted nucleic acid-binding protein